MQPSPCCNGAWWRMWTIAGRIYCNRSNAQALYYYNSHGNTLMQASTNIQIILTKVHAALTGRAGEVVEALSDTKVDMVCIQETWQKGSGCKIYRPKGKRYKLFWGKGRYAPRISIKSFAICDCHGSIIYRIQSCLNTGIVVHRWPHCVAETEDDLIKRLNEWKDNVENRGIRVNKSKTKVMINGERQMVTQKAVRWPYGVCGRGVGNNSIQHTSCQK